MPRLGKKIILFLLITESSCMEGGCPGSPGPLHCDQPVPREQACSQGWQSPQSSQKSPRTVINSSTCYTEPTVEKRMEREMQIKTRPNSYL